MTQIISARLDRALRRGILFAVALVVVVGGLGFYHFRSSAYWNVGKTVDQPIGFRHDLHVKEIGLDCSFCHQGALAAPEAGMPSAETCLICHRHVWRGSQALQPLFTSVELGQPIRWKSLYQLPEHTRFHHGAHSASSIGCSACHGDVGTMPKTEKAKPMSMAWCIDCHRPVGEARQPVIPAALENRGLALANPRLTDCSTCHY